MKTVQNILIAFLLNLAFSVFELFGGLYTGSIAIISDAVHDVGDAFSIGISYFLEKKSKQQPDENFTYGYSRYSVIGSLITTVILIIGSALLIYNAIGRILSPTQIHYNGMIIFAIVGVLVNLIAAIITRDGDSLNQKAVNLHMLEDVLGWIIVLIGAIVMRFTDFALIDPIMSIGVALFILWNAVKNLKDVFSVFVEKIPKSICVNEIREHLLHMDEILDVHHIHIWSLDGSNHCATMHIVTNGDHKAVKERVRQELLEHGIGHITLELEAENEICSQHQCKIHTTSHHHHHHHHHH